MRAGDRFTDDQAEIVFSDVFVEQLEDLPADEQIAVLREVVRLCDHPAGDHPLSARGSRALVGLNTLVVLGRRARVVYRADLEPGLIHVLCLGPRRDSEVYTLAAALMMTGLLDDDEVTQMWDALGLLDVAAEDAGLDGWDYRPPPAPLGMRKAAVAAGLLTEEDAALLSVDEVRAAMEEGWGADGPDRDAALEAAWRRARGGAGFDSALILEKRRADRCGAPMPRAQVRCIRRSGHPGPHRAR